MTEAEPFVTVAVGLLVGGIATYVAARVVAGARSYAYAAVTALFGASGWGVVVLLLGAGSLGSRLVPLVVWVAVVKWRYRESWPRAASIGFVAWTSVLLAILLLSRSGSGAGFGSFVG
ncbi:hypothetical protein [Haloparvum sp. AD34]